MQFCQHANTKCTRHLQFVNKLINTRTINTTDFFFFRYLENL